MNTDKTEAWSAFKLVKAPLNNFELTNLQANSFYEIEILARNDIGPSAAQPFRIRTLPSFAGKSPNSQCEIVFSSLLFLLLRSRLCVVFFNLDFGPITFPHHHQLMEIWIWNMCIYDACYMKPTAATAISPASAHRPTFAKEPDRTDRLLSSTKCTCTTQPTTLLASLAQQT